MRIIAIACLLALALLVTSCGSSTTNTAPQTASGTWQAALTQPAGGFTNLDFVTTFTVNTDGSLNVTGLTFINAQSCFVNESAGGSSDLITNPNFIVTGPITYKIDSQSPTGNSLTLTGSENGSTITGTWAMTGSSECTGSGNYTMCQTGSQNGTTCSLFP